MVWVEDIIVIAVILLVLWWIGTVMNWWGE
jgi:hypothetical protein